MAFHILLSEEAETELDELRPFDQRKVVEAMKAQLSDEPTKATRNRKCLPGLKPSFAHEPPLWEVRVGGLRVFYDVDEDNHQVHVRAIRRKSPGQTTEDIV